MAIRERTSSLPNAAPKLSGDSRSGLVSPAGKSLFPAGTPDSKMTCTWKYNLFC